MIQSLNNHQGERNNRTKLTDAEILNIRHRVHILHEEQLTVYQDYKTKVSFDAFRKIVRGETWQHLDCSMIGNLSIQRKGKPKAKLTKEDVIRIRYEYENHLKTLEELKQEFSHITPATIRRVINYQTWKNI